LPSKPLRDAYERKKAEVMDKRYKTWGQELEYEVRKTGWKYASYQDIADHVLKNKKEFMNEKGRVDAFLIAAQLGISLTKAYVVKRIIELKEGAQNV